MLSLDSMMFFCIQLTLNEILHNVYPLAIFTAIISVRRGDEYGIKSYHT